MFAVFCLWSFIEMKQRQQRDDDKEAEFWERERAANNVRRKPIDYLDYVKIPDDLPTDLLPDNIEMPYILSTVEMLRGQKILNLTGFTNTDLKLEYGTANITELSTYDENFTTLVTTFQKWADVLLDNNYEEEAVKLMEYLVSVNADIGKTYRLLAKYYVTNKMPDKLASLKESAGKLRSINGPHIVKAIEDIEKEWSFF